MILGGNNMFLNLKNILEQKEKSIYWLAIQCEVTYKTMFNLVNNKTTSVKFFILERICNALEVTPNEIFVFKISNDEEA
jgi:putative transcriptional regulator